MQSEQSEREPTQTQSLNDLVSFKGADDCTDNRLKNHSAISRIVERMRVEVFDALTDSQACRIAQILSEEIPKVEKTKPSTTNEKQSFISEGTKRLNLKQNQQKSETSPF